MYLHFGTAFVYFYNIPILKCIQNVKSTHILPPTEISDNMQRLKQTSSELRTTEPKVLLCITVLPLLYTVNCANTSDLDKWCINEFRPSAFHV